ncbi:electron transfer flavoprotein subunit alpha/FixB family protein [Halovenus salina]|uniref:electron transfer flavoprotein subunit alpha/FixB family protein n=1 Tax=Halovenus salina TaxID=1510225 RepID=UPI002260B42E|nr:electron transfer flavoprotein subunit alpha/FixB family protein [Halovenus salina]
MSDVLAVTEHRRGDLRDESFELVTAGRELADGTGGDLHLAVISGDVDTFAEELNREGVDAIHTVEHGEEFNHDAYTQVIEQLADELDAQYVVSPHSVNGLDYAPAVAQTLGYPLVTDIVGADTGDGLSVTRELYNGKTEADIAVDSERAFVTIRPGEWEPAEGEGSAAIEEFDATIDEEQVRSTVTGFEEVGSGDVDISEADVLVSVGRGIDEEDNLDIIFDLADALDATVSSSRPIVDNGWLPQDRQVGQSGKKVTPEVYIAVGISGAVQHVAGMKGAENIIAINNDPSAPIYDIADYGIVDDLFEVVPALTEQFE